MRLARMSIWSMMRYWRTEVTYFGCLLPSQWVSAAGESQLTAVSRHPIYDFMQDYLRLSVSCQPTDSLSSRQWTRYQKNAKGHML